MLIGIDHINIVVNDLEKSVHFYTKLLGFTEFRRAELSGDWIENIVGLKNVSAKVAYIIAPAGEPRIELLQYVTPKGESIPANSLANTTGLRHLAFKVENISEFVNRLKSAGVEFINNPVSVPTGVIKHDDGHKHLCYFYDPDGVLLEFAEYVN